MPTFSTRTELTISAAEANRGFSRVLREVSQGASYVVTSHGRPVAKVTPYEARSDRDSAWKALMERLRTQPAQDFGPWTREELHERGGDV